MPLIFVEEYPLGNLEPNQIRSMRPAAPAARSTTFQGIRTVVRMESWFHAAETGTGKLSRFANLIWRPMAACALLTGLAASALVPQAVQAATSQWEPDLSYTAASDYSVASIPDLGRELTGFSGDSEFAGMIGVRAIAAARTAQRAEVGGQAGSSALEVVTVFEPYERIEQQDPNRFSDLPPLVVQAGRTGETTRFYRHSGLAGSSELQPLLEIAAATRQDEIVAIGTRARPATTGFSGDMVTGGIDESIWVALAQCESGGRPDVISAGGRFHGLYQFSVATWNSVGGTGLPSQASPEEQRYRAVALQARSGWGQWPACTRRLGLR